MVEFGDCKQTIKTVRGQMKGSIPLKKILLMLGLHFSYNKINPHSKGIKNSILLK